MLTAETITDEQIRGLLESNSNALRILVDTQIRFNLLAQNLYCETALADGIPADMRTMARGECAKALNTRREMTTGTCAVCGDRIARDGTCEHVRRLLAAGGRVRP